jgi:phosphoribosyl-ATP pyrophosphohydrolase/phosphoribosyl-AMP cyclohydrolase
MKEELSEIKFDTSGLVPVIVQDADTDQVLMLAYMNSESLHLTIKTGKPGFGHVVVRSCGTRDPHQEISKRL